MKNLILATTTLLSAGLFGACTASSSSSSPCDDIDLIGGESACLDIVVVCPEGADEFEVTGVGETVIETCANGQTAIEVSPGAYDMVVTPYDGDIAFQNEFVELDVEVGDIELYTFNFENYDVGWGRMGLTWTFEDMQPSAALCTQYGIDGVSSLATIAGTDEAYDDIFDCDVGMGVTDPLPLADYVVAMSAIDANDDVVASAAEQEIRLVDQGVIFDTGNFNFTAE